MRAKPVALPTSAKSPSQDQLFLDSPGISKIGNDQKLK